MPPPAIPAVVHTFDDAVAMVETTINQSPHTTLGPADHPLPVAKITINQSLLSRITFGTQGVRQSQLGLVGSCIM